MHCEQSGQLEGNAEPGRVACKNLILFYSLFLNLELTISRFFGTVVSAKSRSNLVKIDPL